MSGLLASGRNMRQTAQKALTEYVRNETNLNRQDLALDAQKQAQETQLYGAGMGIGGAYGVNKALAAKDAAGVAAPKGISASAAAANAPQGVSGLQYVGGGLESLGPMGGTPPGAIETLSGAAETAKLAGETSASVSQALGTAGGEAVKTAGGEAIKAAGGKVAAGSSSGALASLGTIAAPIAIGLGAAFLINKLFG